MGVVHVGGEVAGCVVRRDYVRVERSHENFVAENRESAIDATAAGPDVAWQGALILPDRASKSCIESKRAVVLARGIQNAVLDQWRRLEFSAGHGLIYPLRHQLVGVGGRDPLQRGI